ncbi:hypothetical protein BS47DRAFT_1337088, partial [Hydnum rufescens UP504]
MACPNVSKPRRCQKSLSAPLMVASIDLPTEIIEKILLGLSPNDLVDAREVSISD